MLTFEIEAEKTLSALKQKKYEEEQDLKQKQLEMGKKKLENEHEVEKNEAEIQPQMKIFQLECERDKTLIRANAERLNTFVTILPSHSTSPDQIVTTCSSVLYCALLGDMIPPLLY